MHWFKYRVNWMALFGYTELTSPYNLANRILFSSQIKFCHFNWSWKVPRKSLSHLSTYITIYTSVIQLWLYLDWWEYYFSSCLVILLTFMDLILIDLKEIYCYFHWSVSIFKEKTVYLHRKKGNTFLGWDCFNTYFLLVSCMEKLI